MKIITSSYLYMLHTNINKKLIKFSYKDSVDEISNEEEDTLPPNTPTLGHQEFRIK